jgi:hypothetical protein
MSRPSRLGGWSKTARTRRVLERPPGERAAAFAAVLVALVALRRRLAVSKSVLAHRLVEIYKSGKPDALSVVLSAHGMVDLLERGEFLRRINDQDRAIVRAVRNARDASRRATIQLGNLEEVQRRAAAGIAAQSAAIASMRQALAAKHAAARTARSSPTPGGGPAGSGPAAYLAPKAEQDRVAAWLWNGGAGARNWDCAAIVHRR